MREVQKAICPSDTPIPLYINVQTILSTTKGIPMAEMIETMNTDFIQLARAKGLTARQISNRHAYRNSMIPVLTLIGPMAANILTGSALIEQISQFLVLANSLLPLFQQKIILSLWEPLLFMLLCLW